MKLSGLTLAAIAAGTLFAAAPAVAQHHVEVHRTTTTTTRNGPDIRVERHVDRHVDRHHVRRHKVCRTRWVDHRKVRRCFWR